jgi:hypothetical protein
MLYLAFSYVKENGGNVTYWQKTFNKIFVNKNLLC